jgi:hypothetical protein
MYKFIDAHENNLNTTDLIWVHVKYREENQIFKQIKLVKKMVENMAENQIFEYIKISQKDGGKYGSTLTLMSICYVGWVVD